MPRPRFHDKPLTLSGQERAISLAYRDHPELAKVAARFGCSTKKVQRTIERVQELELLERVRQGAA